nr:immunoglobulin light chain junction region [Macaca mulatta]
DYYCAIGRGSGPVF